LPLIIALGFSPCASIMSNSYRGGVLDSSALPQYYHNHLSSKRRSFASKAQQIQQENLKLQHKLNEIHANNTHTATKHLYNLKSKQIASKHSPSPLILPSNRLKIKFHKFDGHQNVGPGPSRPKTANSRSTASQQADYSRPQSHQSQRSAINSHFDEKSAISSDTGYNSMFWSASAANEHYESVQSAYQRQDYQYPFMQPTDPVNHFLPLHQLSGHSNIPNLSEFSVFQPHFRAPPPNYPPPPLPFNVSLPPHSAASAGNASIPGNAQGAVRELWRLAVEEDGEDEEEGNLSFEIKVAQEKEEKQNESDSPLNDLHNFNNNNHHSFDGNHGIIEGNNDNAEDYGGEENSNNVQNSGPSEEELASDTFLHTINANHFKIEQQLASLQLHNIKNSAFVPLSAIDSLENSQELDENQPRIIRRGRDSRS
jgi:hypothetical protein